MVLVKQLILVFGLILEVKSEGVKVYTVLKDYHITSPIHSSFTCDKFCRKTCIHRCGCNVGCASLSVNQELQICHIHHSYIYDEDSEYSGDVGWQYLQLRTEHVTKGDWTLVFRLTPNIGQTSMSSWSNSGHHDDPANMDGVLPGCQTVNSSKSCDRHFRSGILDDWASYNIQEVKLELYKNGEVQQYIIFNGVGSDATSWFDQNRVLNSSWTDIKANSFEYFAVHGFDGRKFYIMTHGGCDGDIGLLSVRDSRVECVWEDIGGTGTPTVLFSASTTRTLANNFVAAELLAVFVKVE